MILIADSGSTKTDWRLVNTKNEEILSFNSIGFNPYFIDESSILIALNSSLLQAYQNRVKEVFFYGAGCSSIKNRASVTKALRIFFNNASTVLVEHDLLAAARAVSNAKPSLVAILGTGSNTCLFNGQKITQNIPALGYLLGDEGSGAYLGLQFIKRYLQNDFEDEVKQAFKQKYPTLDLVAILDAVYKQPLPNRFLAQFSHFIFSFKENKAIKVLIHNSFSVFFENYIIRYPGFSNYDLHLVGSVAYYYQDFIKQVAIKYNVTIGIIIKQPIDGLVDFHLKKYNC